MLSKPYNFKMKYNIVFSLPVHEKFDVILD